MESCAKLQAQLERLQKQIVSLLQEEKATVSARLGEITSSINEYFRTQAAEEEEEELDYEKIGKARGRVKIPGIYLAGDEKKDTPVAAQIAAVLPVDPSVANDPDLSPKTQQEIAARIAAYNEFLDREQKRAQEFNLAIQRDGAIIQRAQETQSEIDDIRNQVSLLGPAQLEQQAPLLQHLREQQSKNVALIKAREAALLNIVRSNSELQKIKLALIRENLTLRAIVEHLIAVDLRTQYFNRQATSVAAEQRICLRRYVREVEQFQAALLALIAKYERVLTSRITALFDIYRRECAVTPPPAPPPPPRRHRQTITAQSSDVLAAFEKEAMTLLGKLVGPPPSFQRFCELSNPEFGGPHLSPWQQFAEVLAEIQTRTLLAAGETGSGKTNFALTALARLMFRRANFPDEAHELPSRALIFVPKTISEQWQVNINGLATSELIIPDAAERKRITHSGMKARSVGTSYWRFRVDDDEFEIVLQAAAYAFNPKQATDWGMDRISGGKKTIADFRKLTDLFLIVDEYHKYAFEETFVEYDKNGKPHYPEYALDSSSNPDENKAIYNAIYYQILSFAQRQVPAHRTAKFLALTATPLTYGGDGQAAEEAERDSLRALLPFQLAVENPAITSLVPGDLKAWNATAVRRVVERWASLRGSAGITEFLREYCRGFVSYVNYEQCPWMPSYGTDCQGDVCMWVPTTDGKFVKQPLFPFPPPSSTDSGRTPEPTDFVPIIVRPRTGGRTLEFDEKEAYRRMSEYQSTAKGESIARFLEANYRETPALIYAPCSNSPGQSAPCTLMLAEQIVPKSKTVWFWPSEQAKDTKTGKKINGYNAAAKFGADEMKRLYDELEALKKKGGSGKEFLEAITKRLGDRHGVVIYSRISGIYDKERAERFRNLQSYFMQAFAQQSKLPADQRRPLKWLFAQIATGLDASGANVLISTIPVREGTFAAQLLGRIARLSATGYAQHENLRAYQTITAKQTKSGARKKKGGKESKEEVEELEYEGAPEVEMAKKYYSSRLIANRVLQDVLPLAAIDRLWFGPPKARGEAAPSDVVPTLPGGEGKEEAFVATPTTALIDTVWILARQLVEYNHNLKRDLVASLEELWKTDEGKRTEKKWSDALAVQDLSKYLVELQQLLSPSERQEMAPVVQDLLELGGKGKLHVFLQKYHYLPPTERKSRPAVDQWLSLGAPNALHDFKLDLSEIKETDAPTFAERLGEMAGTFRKVGAAVALAYNVIMDRPELTEQMDQLVMAQWSQTPSRLKESVQQSVKLHLATLSAADLADLANTMTHTIGSLLSHFSAEPCPSSLKPTEPTVPSTLPTTPSTRDVRVKTEEEKKEEDEKPYFFTPF